ncbi:PRC-barrel domain-containing protein [Herbaspirillum sp. GCM10030257]|uniref:PRC-barrel domain-containing protein n=1 Tax=Herbaspirillum sp. GCM10030257 TaxID=3273393 RepID=UPI00361FA871
MLRTLCGRSRNDPPRNGPKRFVRLSGQDSSTAELLAGCAVVTASGERIGHVDHLMIDAVTHQLRYVILSRRRSGAVVALPWQGLYFDAANARLVFYTLG